MKFTKPKGAVADLRELEYIASLHQTGSTIRRDGSIRTDDITKFLISRYGIQVTEADVADTIAKGFGGGGISEDDGDTLDLCEIVALLLVPTLLKAEMSLHRDHLEREKVRGSHLHLGNDVDTDDPSEQVVDDPVPAVGTSTTTKQQHDMNFHSQKAGRDDVWNSVNGGSRSLRGEDRWPDYDIIEFVLGMILRDVTGDDKPKPMTKELLKKIFVFYGEHDVAEDDRLLEEMISVASHMQIMPDGERTEPILDVFTFAHCLTMDVRAYNPKTEGRLSTNFNDVYESKNDQHGASMPEEEVHHVKKVFTFSSIDYAVDTFRSKLFVTLLWVVWALFFWMYMNGSSSSGQGDLNCDEKDTEGKIFGCNIAQGIISWLLIMAKLVIIGSGFVILCSAGQSINHTNPLSLVLSVTSMGFICMMTFVPAFQTFQIMKEEDYVDEYGYPVEGGALIDTSREGRAEYQLFIIYLIVACGVVLMLLAIQNLLDQLVPVVYKDKYKLLKKCLASGTVTMERNMKQAAAFKINRMVRSAVDIHKAAEFEHGAGSSSRESSCGRALLTFTKALDDQEEVGGYFWAWRRLFNGKMFTEDGIWLNNRMLQGNISQLVICLWLIPFLKVLVELINLFYESLLADYSPERWRIVVPIGIAFACAEFNALKLASCYIPSSVKTTLNFRHGVIGSLHDDEFQKLRSSVDENSFIFGAMFWGCLLSSSFILIITFLIVSLICFKEFQSIFVATVATIIGIGITIMMKSLFISLSRKFFHDKAFYRTNPAAANFVGVMLESWNLGITTLYVLKRMVTLLAAAFFFIGRIDVPFLGEGADEIGPVKLDKFPFIFRKDLLLHEAHRHPYLERIGLIYMMKLRYMDNFGREAGTSWRLLFVFALMPWLRKYRIRSDDNLKVDTFKFSKPSDVFQKFTSDDTGGKRGCLSTVPEDGSSTTIAGLKQEIDDLKEENGRLKELEEEVEELRSKLATTSPGDSFLRAF
mmetsp:Transcript_6580/g.14884  ORF Transcript_6580/g.14884 Transcript_6580/m.14884 type:complete len:982 (+) Transcript_6580:198-3143(+)|eukprot:CAMPEP_0172323492 /NCGR_PEP_ID=MMETSP1058-20130122/48843_1 /TAXON_ID=83371 /ORGANISM="Detonula confervacea, Strain CCMP 353" /LENGTH=981 /DNA_ID=CAMNT_0013039499 /DNA_START=114 /DNA_END=3059 /DNA_ORIENTATION=+